MKSKINVYEVGGVCRDRYLGLKPSDIDYAVEADSFESMRNYILESSGTIYLEKPEYFTIRGKLKNIDADFVLCRKDGFYRDNRRPESVEVGTIYDDLSRRDFSINSFCRNIETNEILDPFNGRQDLDDKIIRCTGSISRLEEDPLRIIRALRFAFTLNFTLDHEIQNFLYVKPHLIKKVATERVVDEINKIISKIGIHSFSHQLYSLHRDWDLHKAIFDNPEIQAKFVTRKN